MTAIYGLHDPETGELRYIGKANDPAKRLKSHVRDARRRNTPLYSWIRKLAASGLLPEMRVMSEVPEQDWPQEERRLIALHKSRRLLNVAEGGDEPHCPMDVRQENGRKVAAARQSDPFKRRIWELKRELGGALKRGELKERHLAAMRQAAQRAPHLFGSWAHL